jgi:hypothetical protein
MFSNYDAQKLLNSNDELRRYLIEMKDIGPGSGETNIHLYALQQLIEEIAWHRTFGKE